MRRIVGELYQQALLPAHCALLGGDYVSGGYGRRSSAARTFATDRAGPDPTLRRPRQPCADTPHAPRGLDRTPSSHWNPRQRRRPYSGWPVQPAARRPERHVAAVPCGDSPSRARANRPDTVAAVAVAQTTASPPVCGGLGWPGSRAAARVAGLGPGRGGLGVHRRPPGHLA